MKQKYKEYLLSDAWAKTRCDAILYADNKCEVCSRTKNLQVHHLSYKNVGCEEPDDLIVLCAKCHMIEHGIIKIKRKRKKKKKAKQKFVKPIPRPIQPPEQPVDKTPCPTCGEPLFFSKTVIACMCGYRESVSK